MISRFVYILVFIVMAFLPNILCIAKSSQPYDRTKYSPYNYTPIKLSISFTNDTIKKSCYWKECNNDAVLTSEFIISNPGEAIDSNQVFDSDYQNLLIELDDNAYLLISYNIFSMQTDATVLPLIKYDPSDPYDRTGLEYLHANFGNISMYEYALSLSDEDIKIGPYERLLNTIVRQDSSRISFSVSPNPYCDITFLNLPRNLLSQAIDILDSFRFRNYITSKDTDSEHNWYQLIGSSSELENFINTYKSVYVPRLNMAEISSKVLLSEKLAPKGNVFIFSTPGLQNDIDPDVSIDSTTDLIDFAQNIANINTADINFDKIKNAELTIPTEKQRNSTTFAITLDSLCFVFTNIDKHNVVDYLVMARDMARLIRSNDKISIQQ